MDFVKQRLFYVIGGACILVIGLIYFFNTDRPGAAVDDEDVFFVSASALVDASQTQEVPFTAATPNAAADQQVAANSDAETKTIFVHIVGAVHRPGIIELPVGSRLHHAVEAAGGACDDADTSQLNLADYVHDAMKIIVPKMGEHIDEMLIYAKTVIGSGMTVTDVSLGIIDGIVCINNASHAELQTLPGVGPVLAQNIIDYRETNGHFTYIDELINVSRIGQTTLERLRPFITVR